MAEKKKTNTVKLVGYLKENNLEQITNARGDKVIRGSLIIATDKISSHKVQFYVAETTSNGEDSKDYASLLTLLPDNTITIASFLKENSSADFDTAANASSKVWVMARFEEYATRSGERTRSMVTLKGFRAGFSKADKAFTPCAEFDVDVYINKIEPEVENEEKTGRLLIEGLIPKYNGSVDVVDFVAVSEDGVSKYIGEHYAVGDTVNLKGDVVSLQDRQLVETEDTEYFGRSSGPQYETKFIRERRVVGGSKNPLHEGDEGAITKQFVKEGLAARELKMDENGVKAKSSPNGGAQTAAAAPKKTSTPDDLDF